MSGGKSQKSTTTTALPPWLEDSVRTATGIAEERAKMGYVPYTGPDVAAFDPQQVQAMQGGADMAAMFGVAPRQDVSVNIPKPQTFAGGIRGYSSLPLFEESKATLAKKYPGLDTYLKSFFIDPKTGVLPKNNAWDRVATDIAADSKIKKPVVTGSSRGPRISDVFKPTNPFIRSGNSR
jgi:hypothetical protein